MEPDLNAFFDQLCSAYAWDWGALTIAPGIASGVVYGSNPPYTASDFLACYPKFGGTTTQITATLTSGSPNVSVSSVADLQSGMLIVGTPSPKTDGTITWGGIPAGATITSVVSGPPASLVLSANALSDGQQTLTVYTAPYVPLLMINTYVVLAQASIMQARWKSQWWAAMGLFIAHFMTLFLRSNGNPNSTEAQVVASGMNVGITVSKGAGPVSQGLALVGGLDGWAAWTMTVEGTLLATWAKTVGMGPVWFR